MDDVFEQMSLSVDQFAEMQNDFERFVTLRQGMFVCFAHASQFDFEFSTIALELFGEFLGHGEGFESIVALTFGSVETFLEVCGIGLLFVDKNGKAMSFAFVLFDLGFEFLRLFCEFRGKSLEFFKLEIRL